MTILPYLCKAVFHAFGYFFEMSRSIKVSIHASTQTFRKRDYHRFPCNRMVAINLVYEAASCDTLGLLEKWFRGSE